MSDPAACPCGWGRPYAACCGTIHEGGEAVTAEALMRSRFSAFALGLPDYLLRSWHPSTRPAKLELDEGTMWRRLQIVDAAAGGPDDADGVVEFRAAFRSDAGIGLLHERSRFSRDPASGEWRYVDGDVRE